MGRKVHPVGFRLGVIKDWEARWFAPKGKYAQQLQQDFTIRRLIANELQRSGISQNSTRFSIRSGTATREVLVSTSMSAGEGTFAATLCGWPFSSTKRLESAQLVTRSRPSGRNAAPSC